MRSAARERHTLAARISCSSTDQRRPSVRSTTGAFGAINPFNPVFIKAKFHYTSWFGESSELASVMEFGL